MKTIKITLQAEVEVPDYVELGEDHSGLPYYLIMNSLEIHPALSFDAHGELSSPDDFNCEVVSLNTLIEEIE
jgi:hypothetical protein